ncbi:MAG TPA: cation-transporting P-type ATPase, partial [Chromatiaceae bacterium]|nr:cation-transporting P-type ATPase [Chromatiaceae bacterium]
DSAPAARMANFPLPIDYPHGMHLANLPLAEALQSLGTTATGLTSAEAARRLGEYGENRLAAIGVEPQWRRFLREFTHFFALILWVAAGLAFFAESREPGTGMWQLGAAILAVILINGTFSFWQEYRAELAIEALRKLLPPAAKVLRDGQLTSLPAALLVPGDIILLEAGDDVPADCRLIASADIRVNAATLTGESLPKAKSATEHPEHQPPLEMRNLLLAGTSLVSGEGQALVFATGMHTEFGQIAHLTQTSGGTPSHLQAEIARLSRLVAIFATGLGLLFFGVGQWLGLPFWTSLMFAIGIIVANVPEGLLPTVTLSLAMATQRMAKRNALVHHLPAVETLGATTVICSDKTGTLTENCMSVRQVWWRGRFWDGPLPAPKPTGLGFGMAPAGTKNTENTGNTWGTLSRGDAGSMTGTGDQDEGGVTEDAGGMLGTVDPGHLLRNLAVCHSLKRGTRESRPVWLGDPMELALADYARQSLTFTDMQPAGELPFDHERRRMAVIVEREGARWLYCKGAPEAVLPLCVAQETEAGDIAALHHDSRKALVQAQQQMADAGLRVLACAWRRLRAEEKPREEDLVLSGLVGLYDPPRPEVPAAIARCQAAGIKVIMVTGDHPHTALAIAREIGLVRGSAPKVILGGSLRRLTKAQLQTALDSPEILFARVSAEQKMLVVNALKRKGEIVAVTGDGVNDAPALKSAHIGIAMGLTGTDVAKSAADLILLDDNFASIVNAVEEGRAVFANIRKFLTYILTSNVPELVPYLLYVLLRIPLPLTIIQILAVDLGTDMLPALALALVFGALEEGRKRLRSAPL